MVEAVGEGVSTFAVGDRVYTTGSVSGTLAEYALCTTDTVHPLPANVTFAQGACIGVPCATAYRALFLRCAAKLGDAVLIHGASGAVGLAATQLAIDRGCIVVGTAGTAAGESAISALGATAVNHRSDDYLQSASAALPAAKQGKFDIVLEMAAHANLLADVGMVQKHGRIAIIGSKPLPVALNPRLLMPSEITLHGVFMPAASADEKAATHQGLYEAMERGGLAPNVGLALPLSEAAKAHVEIAEPSTGGKVGNIVLIVREE